MNIFESELTLKALRRAVIRTIASYVKACRGMYDQSNTKVLTKTIPQESEDLLMKLLAVILILIFAVSLGGCGGHSNAIPSFSVETTGMLTPSSTSMPTPTSVPTTTAPVLTSVPTMATPVPTQTEGGVSEPIKRGNTIGNIISGWYEVVQNDILYSVLFNSDTNNYALYKSNLDGSDESIIYNKGIHQINIIDNWIYYTDTDNNGFIYKMELDGSNITLISNDEAFNVNVVGEWIYYSLFPYNGLYKIKTDGTNKTLLYNDKCSDVIVDVDVDDWIYFCGEDDSLHKIKTDGSNVMRLNDDACSYPNMYGDWIYYATKNGFYKIKTDGSQKEKLHNDKLSYINVDNEWIYFTKFTGDGGLYKMKLDGSEETKLDEGGRNGRVMAISVFGDWIRYVKDIFRDHEVYQIKKDGTEKKLIRPGIYMPWKRPWETKREPRKSGSCGFV